MLQYSAPPHEHTTAPAAAGATSRAAPCGPRCLSHASHARVRGWASSCARCHVAGGCSSCGAGYAALKASMAGPRRSSIACLSAATLQVCSASRDVSGAPCSQSVVCTCTDAATADDMHKASTCTTHGSMTDSTCRCRPDVSPSTGCKQVSDNHCSFSNVNLVRHHLHTDMQSQLMMTVHIKCSGCHLSLGSL